MAALWLFVLAIWIVHLDGNLRALGDGKDSARLKKHLHGPSVAIGLADYLGDELAVYDACSGDGNLICSCLDGGADNFGHGSGEDHLRLAVAVEKQGRLSDLREPQRPDSRSVGNILNPQQRTVGTGAGVPRLKELPRIILIMCPESFNAEGYAPRDGLEHWCDDRLRFRLPLAILVVETPAGLEAFKRNLASRCLREVFLLRLELLWVH